MEDLGRHIKVFLSGYIIANIVTDKYCFVYQSKTL